MRMSSKSRAAQRAIITEKEAILRLLSETMGVRDETHIFSKLFAIFASEQSGAIVASSR